MAKGFKHGSSGELRKPPVLNDAYPQNVTVDNAGSSVTFETIITEAGKPAEYTYQWYYDGNAVEGETGASYTRAAEFGEHTVFCTVTNAAGSAISRTATVTAETQYLYNRGTFDPIAGTLARSNDKVNYTIGTDSLHIWSVSGAGHVYFTNKVDLTPFKTLYWTGSCEITGAGDNWGSFQFGAFSSLSASASASISGAKGQGTHSIDVSGLSGEYYISYYPKGSALYADTYTDEVYLK